jgi:hypothetical protein
MGFWSGFEGLTGHRPGAFKGFRLKDIIDKDLWERKQRTWSGKMLPQGATEAERQRDLRFSRGGEPMMTNWYKGRGAVAPLNANERRASDLMRDQGMQAVQESQRVDSTLPSYAEQHAAIMRNRYPGGQTTVSAARPWPNIQPENLLTPSWAGSAASADRDVGMGAGRFLQLGDPQNIRSGPDLPPASGFRSPAVGMLRREPVQRVVPPTPPGVTDEFKFGQWFPVNTQADEKTVIQNFADPSKANKITTTFETKEQPQSQPTSIMNMFNVDAWRDLARRKWEERMRARRGY